MVLGTSAIVTADSMHNQNEENRYKLAAVNSLFLRNCPEYVTFRYPVPSPKYLAIHAACAQVAHLSGAAKCIDKFYEDMEYRTTLDTDGACGDVRTCHIRTTGSRSSNCILNSVQLESAYSRFALDLSSRSQCLSYSVIEIVGGKM